MHCFQHDPASRPGLESPQMTRPNNPWLGCETGLASGTIDEREDAPARGNGRLSTMFGNVTFDQSPVIGASLEDLDLVEVEQHLTACRERGRYNGTASEPLEFLVEQRAVVEIERTVFPTVAGIMFFGHQPQRFMPFATAKLAHYLGSQISSNEVRHIEEYAGTVRQQADRAVEYLGSHIERGYILDGGAKRIERPQYPPTALRELTVNALAHRDYTMLGSSTRIAMFPNRIEWASPGTLPAGITPDNILTEQFARNPYLTQLLYQAGYVEAYGQGLDTVFNVLADQALPLPEMRESSNTFVISITGHTPLGIGADRLSGLTDPQLRIVALLRQQSLSGGDLIRAMEPRSERSVQNDLRALIELGVIERIGRARGIKYTLISEAR